MDEKHRISGFKALLDYHQTNVSYLEQFDGSLQLWRDLSAEGKLEWIARDAAYYDVPFEAFAEAVRESVDTAAVEGAALRLAMRSARELHELEELFPDDGRTESPPPLVERVRELLETESPQDEDEEVLSCEKLAALFKEMREVEALARRDGSHWNGKVALQNVPEGKTDARATKEKDQRWKDEVEHVR